MSEQQRHLPSASTEIEPQVTIAVDRQQPLRKFRVEWGILYSRESGGTGLQIIACFQKQILWFQSLHLLISREPPSPFIVMLDPHD